MPRVNVFVELSECQFRAYIEEAARRGIDVEALVQTMVQGLVADMKREELEGTDHPIIPA